MIAVAASPCSAVMAEGLKARVAALYETGRAGRDQIAITDDGALIALPAMKELPFGVPKVLISSADGPAPDTPRG